MKIEIVRSSSLGKDIEDFGMRWAIACRARGRWRLFNLAVDDAGRLLLFRRVTEAKGQARAWDELHPGAWEYRVIRVRVCLA